MRPRFLHARRARNRPVAAKRVLWLSSLALISQLPDGRGPPLRPYTPHARRFCGSVSATASTAGAARHTPAGLGNGHRGTRSPGKITSGSVAAFATSEPSLALSRDPTRWARARHWRKSEQIQIPRYFCGLAVHGLISQQVSNYVLMNINYIRSKHSSFCMFQSHVNKTREWM